MKKSVQDSRVKKALKKLRKIYKEIPDTTVCLENINKENGCKGKCCKFQSPSLLYCEFLNVWNTVLASWKLEKIADIIEDSMRMITSADLPMSMPI